MLPFIIVSQDEFTAVTLDEAKHQCRLMPSFTMDDDYLSALILAAASSAQEYLHWLVSPGTVKQYVQSNGVGDEIVLYGNTIATNIEVVADGVTLTTDDYTYNDVTNAITMNSAQVEVFITYNNGPEPDDLPKNVKIAILMLISTMYNNREDFVTGLSVESMPLRSKKLLGLSRHYVS